jgi:hypothetical protein
MNTEIIADQKMIAYCGLFCGACRKYLKGSCPGCQENVKASWCKVRTCCMEHNYASCADCTLMSLEECKKFNNFMAKLFGMIFNSDRPACIREIQSNGYTEFAGMMAAKRKQSLPRRK